MAGLQRINGLHAQIHHLVKLFGVASMRIDSGIGAKADLHAFRESVLKRLANGGDSRCAFEIAGGK